MEILVMSDSGQHRKRILRNNSGEIIVIITRQIKLGSTSTKNQHGIPEFRTLIYTVQSGNDGFRTALSLHLRLEQDGIQYESIWIFLYVTHEITIAGSIFCRNHSKTVWQHSHRDFLLKAHESLPGKPLDGSLSFQLLKTYGKLRVNIIYYQRHAIKFTIIHLDLHKNNHAFLQRRTGHRFKIRSYETISGAPYDGICLSFKSLGTGLREF